MMSINDIYAFRFHLPLPRCSSIRAAIQQRQDLSASCAGCATYLYLHGIFSG